MNYISPTQMVRTQSLKDSRANLPASLNSTSRMMASHHLTIGQVSIEDIDSEILDIVGALYGLSGGRGCIGYSGVPWSPNSTT